MAMKYAEFPFIMIDLYGRERHPEFTNSEGYDVETYAARRVRIELMLKTFSYVQNGIPPENHILLVEEDYIDLTKRTGSTMTTVSGPMGVGPQFGMVIDLQGRLIHYTNWQRPEQQDEVLSAIFGVEPGL
jgi:hypothetical protein